MSALSEFLLARIAEDEGMAHVAASIGRWALPENIGVHMQSPTGEVVLNPARVLAECEAKRRVIEFIESEFGAETEDCPWTFLEVALAMAAIYADHRDYREEWRP